MNRVSWWLVDFSSRMLEGDEREVVRGDIVESGESAGQAMRDVLGLVIRRQAMLWRNWRPWAVFVGLIVPLAMALSIASKLNVGWTSVYIWMYANNSDWGLLRNHGFWYVFRESATFVLTRWLILGCWAWSSGFILGSVTRRVMFHANVVLLSLMLLLGMAGAPRYFAFYSHFVRSVLSLPQVPVPHSHVDLSAPIFYRVVFPLAVQLFLVAIPAWRGMRAGAEVERLSSKSQMAVRVAAFSSLVAMLIEIPGGLFFLFIALGLWPPHLAGFQLAHLVVFWPIAYLLAQATARRWPRSGLARA